MGLARILRGTHVGACGPLFNLGSNLEEVQMAVSKCVSCGTVGRFEAVDFESLGLQLIQCGHCGGVVGVMDLTMHQKIDKLTKEVGGKN